MILIVYIENICVIGIGSICPCPNQYVINLNETFRTFGTLKTEATLFLMEAATCSRFPDHVTKNADLPINRIVTDSKFIGYRIKSILIRK